MEGSFREFRQIAHVSAQISHDHIVTAFHFLISNLGAFVVDSEDFGVESAAPPDFGASASILTSSDINFIYLLDFKPPNF